MRVDVIHERIYVCRVDSSMDIAARIRHFCYEYLPRMEFEARLGGILVGDNRENLG